MTVRSFMVLALCIQGLWALTGSVLAALPGIDYVAFFSSSWLWCWAALAPVLGGLLIAFRRPLAGLILGAAADTPGPIDHRDLVTVVTAFVGIHMVMFGFGVVQSQVMQWASQSGAGNNGADEGGVTGFWLRHVALLQCGGILGIVVARWMPDIMRLPAARGSGGG